MSIESLTELKTKLKTEALNLGFTHLGICDPKTPSSFPVFQEWLEKGHAAGMSYLSRRDTIEKRRDPKLIFPDVGSILVLALPYNPPISGHEHSFIGKIASYAVGEDYHEIIPDLLEKLMNWLSHQIPDFNLDYRFFTDTGPVLERALAQDAGLGWIGKNSCLLIPGRGSYFFLGEVFINIHFPPDQPFLIDHCGNCRRCIENCPTECINEDRTLDANHCISYLTIENKDTIPLQDREPLGSWIFGCDICQQVCPWNIRFSSVPSPSLFSPNPGLIDFDLLNHENTNLVDFKQKYKSSPILRAKRVGFLRNIIVALSNINTPKTIPALLKIYFSEDNTLIRNLIVWALKRFPLSQIEENFQSLENNNMDFNEIKLDLLSH
jgi:epoxyqueuosine reductase